MTTEKQPVFYSIEAPGVGYYQNGTITADHEVTLNLSSHLSTSSFYDQNKGVCVKTSSERVTVQGVHHTLYYHYRFDYENQLETSVAIPVIDLCSDEYVYYAISVNGSSHYNSTVLIVGTEDTTTMKLTVTQPAIVSVGSTTTNLIAGNKYSFVINRLQTIYIASPSDLTSSKIVTNKQVSVFSGHQYGNILGSPASHLVEQIPPTVLWERVHYVMPLKDVLAGYAIKIVTSNDCVIKIYCNSSSVPTYADKLNSGGFLVKQFSNNEFCKIDSTSEVLVAQFSLGVRFSIYDNIFMALVPSKKQYYNRFKFKIIDENFDEIFSGFGNNEYGYVNIIVMEKYYQPENIYLMASGGNRSLDNEQWVPIKAYNNITEAYATQVNITYDTAEVHHIDEKALMAVMVYGFSHQGSHGTAISSHINKGSYIVHTYLRQYRIKLIHCFKLEFRVVDKSLYH